MMVKSIRFHSKWRFMRAAGWVNRTVPYLPAWFRAWYQRHLWTPFDSEGKIRPDLLAESTGPNYGFYRVGAMRED